MRCKRSGFVISAAERLHRAPDPAMTGRWRFKQAQAQRAIDTLEDASGHAKADPAQLVNDEGIKPRLDKKRKNLKRLFDAF
jgi:hypothetical protein